jgi:hypothetical protein
MAIAEILRYAGCVIMDCGSERNRLITTVTGSRPEFCANIRGMNGFPALYVTLAFTLGVFIATHATVEVLAQSQEVPAATSEKLLPRDPIPQHSPCANQPRSLRGLTESFNKGTVPLAQELKGTWIEIGNFDNGTRPFYRSLNCTGITRGNKFEFALIGVETDYTMELHAIGYEVQRVRMELNHKGSAQFSIDLLADGASDDYTCRLTRRLTLACVDANRGEEFNKIKVVDKQLFTGFEP